MNPGLDIRCATASVAATRAVAAAFAPALRDGDLLVLVGDLGAGKTAFTQGLCHALGVTTPVTSPTFTLANRHVGRLVVNHLDAYRIEDLAEADDLALDELLDDGVTIIEWGHVIRPALPADRLDLAITFGSGDDDRVLEFCPIGGDWPDRLAAVADDLCPRSVR